MNITTIHKIIFLAMSITIIYLIIYNHQQYPTNSPIIESFTKSVNDVVSVILQTNTDLTTAASDINKILNTYPLENPENDAQTYNTLKTSIKNTDSMTSDVQFYIDERTKYKKILDMQNQLDSINNQVTAVVESKHFDTSTKSIKNPISGMNINIAPIKSTSNNNNNNITDTDLNALLYVNGKCVSYAGSGKYKLADCNASDTLQQFIVKKISSYNDYNSLLGDSSQSGFKLTGSDDFTTLAEFNVVLPAIYRTSKYSTSKISECLTTSNKDRSLTIEPCDMLLNQRWNPSPKTLSC